MADRAVLSAPPCRRRRLAVISPEQVAFQGNASLYYCTHTSTEEEQKGYTMSPDWNSPFISRRNFLKALLGAGGAYFLGPYIPSQAILNLQEAVELQFWHQW